MDFEKFFTATSACSQIFLLKEGFCKSARTCRASGQYRLLQRPDGADASSDWTPHALSGSPCVLSTNYHELVGTGFSGFSKFGITVMEDPGKVDNDLDGFTVNQGDCDDTNAAVFPGAPEICDGLDNDCDGNIPTEEVDSDKSLFGGRFWR